MVGGPLFYVFFAFRSLLLPTSRPFPPWPVLCNPQLGESRARGVENEVTVDAKEHNYYTHLNCGGIKFQKYYIPFADLCLIRIHI